MCLYACVLFFFVFARVSQHACDSTKGYTAQVHVVLLFAVDTHARVCFQDTAFEIALQASMVDAAPFTHSTSASKVLNSSCLEVTLSQTVKATGSGATTCTPKSSTKPSGSVSHYAYHFSWVCSQDARKPVSARAEFHKTTIALGKRPPEDLVDADPAPAPKRVCICSLIL